MGGDEARTAGFNGSNARSVLASSFSFSSPSSGSASGGDEVGRSCVMLSMDAASGEDKRETRRERSVGSSWWSDPPKEDKEAQGKDAAVPVEEKDEHREVGGIAVSVVGSGDVRLRRRVGRGRHVSWGEEDEVKTG